MDNALYGTQFALVENVIWTTKELDREMQDAYNLLVLAYGDTGVSTANVSVQSSEMRSRGFI